MRSSASLRFFRPAHPKHPHPRADRSSWAMREAKTILDTYLREVRPRFAPKRTYQRTVYRAAEICQFDLWEPKGEIPVGHGKPDKKGLGRHLRAWVLKGRRRHPDLRQAGSSDIPLGHGSLPGEAGGAAGDRGLGPRGGDAPRRGQAKRCLRRLLRRSWRSAGLILGGGRPEVKGHPGAKTTVSCALNFEPCPGLRLTRALPGPALTSWFSELANSALSPWNQGDSRRAPRQRARADASAARADARHRSALRPYPGAPSSPTCALTPNDYSLDPRAARGAASR